MGKVKGENRPPHTLVQARFDQQDERSAQRRLLAAGLSDVTLQDVKNSPFLS
jgi:hypothetical protein